MLGNLGEGLQGGRRIGMGDEGGRVCVIQGGDGAVVWIGVFSAVKIRHYAHDHKCHPEQRCRFWKRARLRLGARDHDEDPLVQVDVHAPLVVPAVIVVEADGHVRQLRMQI